MIVHETWKPEDTYELGREMGQEAVPGQIACLNDDLGMERAVFIQGFAQGLGTDESANGFASTIVQRYDEDRFPLYHFDVYRIGDVNEVDEIGYEDCFLGEEVCLIERSGLIRNILPDRVTQVIIEKGLEKGFDYRRILVKENR